jgi:excisionase family DNA binding protein
MDRIFYSRLETAKALNVSSRTLDYLIAEGRITSVKLGRRRLFHKDSIENFAGVAVRGQMAL